MTRDVNEGRILAYLTQHLSDLQTNNLPICYSYDKLYFSESISRRMRDVGLRKRLSSLIKEWSRELMESYLSKIERGQGNLDDIVWIYQKDVRDELSKHLSHTNILPSEEEKAEKLLERVVSMKLEKKVPLERLFLFISELDKIYSQAKDSRSMKMKRLSVKARECGRQLIQDFLKLLEKEIGRLEKKGDDPDVLLGMVYRFRRMASRFNSPFGKELHTMLSGEEESIIARWDELKKGRDADMDRDRAYEEWRRLRKPFYEAYKKAKERYLSLKEEMDRLYHKSPERVRRYESAMRTRELEMEKHERELVRIGAFQYKPISERESERAEDFIMDVERLLDESSDIPEVLMLNLKAWEKRVYEYRTKSALERLMSAMDDAHEKILILKIRKIKRFFEESYTMLSNLSPFGARLLLLHTLSQLNSVKIPKWCEEASEEKRRMRMSLPEDELLKRLHSHVPDPEMDITSDLLYFRKMAVFYRNEADALREASAPSEVCERFTELHKRAEEEADFLERCREMLESLEGVRG